MLPGGGVVGGDAGAVGDAVDGVGVGTASDCRPDIIAWLRKKLRGWWMEGAENLMGWFSCVEMDSGIRGKDMGEAGRWLREIKGLKVSAAVGCLFALVHA